MPNNRFSNKLNNLSFSTKFYVFFVKIAMYPKNCEILHFVHGSEAQSQIEVFFDFFSFHYHLGTSIMTNNSFPKNSIILSFSTKFYVFFCEDCNVPKNCEILHFVHGSEAESQIEVFFDFFSFHYHLGTVSCQITFFQKTQLMWVFQRNFMVFFLWRLQCTKKLRNSPLCPREWSSITYGSFLRFFLFSLPFRNSTMPNNRFSKNSIIWVFQRNFMFFLWRLQCTKKLRNSPLCPREWSSITNRSFLRLFLFSLPFRNSTMPNNRFSKNSIIWVFQRNFMFIFVKIAMYEKIAKFSTLSTGVKLNLKTEVFFDFFSFNYHLGTVSYKIKVFQKTQ